MRGTVGDNSRWTNPSSLKYQSQDTFRLPELLQQELDFLLDPLLDAPLPHPEIPQGGEGKSAQLAPRLPVAEEKPWAQKGTLWARASQ